MLTLFTYIDMAMRTNGNRLKLKVKWFRGFSECAFSVFGLNIAERTRKMRPDGSLIIFPLLLLLPFVVLCRIRDVD